MSSLLQYFAWVFMGMLVLTVIELIVPAETGHSARGRLRNLVYFILFHLLGTISLTAIYLIYVPTALWSYSPSGFELALSICLNLLVIDFLFYWYHRAQHRFAWLWQIHELHHSDSELNVTTSYRTYWLEMLFQRIFIIIPTVLIFGGMGLEHAVIVSFVTSFLLMFTHSNLKLHFGVLSSVVCGPQIHRVHHSIEDAHKDKNFAQFFPFIDKIFGTYYKPHHGEFPKTGTPTLKSDERVTTVMLKPFKYWLGSGHAR